jgi:hypothetical protein
MKSHWNRIRHVVIVELCVDVCHVPARTSCGSMASSQTTGRSAAYLTQHSYGMCPPIYTINQQLVSCTSFRCPPPWHQLLRAGCQAPALLHPRRPRPDRAGVVRRLLPGPHPTDLPERQGGHAYLLKSLPLNHSSVPYLDVLAASAPSATVRGDSRRRQAGCPSVRYLPAAGWVDMLLITTINYNTEGYRRCTSSKRPVCGLPGSFQHTLYILLRHAMPSIAQSLQSGGGSSGNLASTWAPEHTWPQPWCPWRFRTSCMGCLHAFHDYVAATPPSISTTRGSRQRSAQPCFSRPGVRPCPTMAAAALLQYPLQPSSSPLLPCGIGYCCCGRH